MKLLFAFSLVLALMQAPAPDPFDHANPRADWFCVPARNAEEVKTHDHACACRGMVMKPECPMPVDPGPDGNGNPQAPYTPEPSNCKVHCKPTHCKCRESCKDT
jgi:hypothetical protein